ncbi:large conductance mechanosensitive channel protein MscL [Propionicimonas sp.]|uniref:large conductance mechanosensitive channel protein MscL n=1 Tax=Propionicimonas sp. TaxID=1955623 RepID=UPI0018155051|nr:large conductance mechanosensitive channel protein MscL [Propionicimonas sp.]MBU3975370.1 large conductance mechanosensitive channel protein MscL [Actinomycetota bacterium]MBA3020224.1 large conductance mechanosensitive channel protein MscL [Propionicimonas sp.]MBU3986481.1 large conductance mechanosensitive channel protein MscL [Actinomycetota bacterium]MBU4008050.1 large conductance mechanosensitive channel protein MscL [Actinomycetota bacterium]MBU4064308.1 large conductance mechanosensi
MAGFKDFLMRGSLVDVAVAFIIGAAFGTVTTSFTKLVMDVIGKVIGGQPDFSAVDVAGVNIGVFITAMISFIITAAVVYFGIVKPYEGLRKRLQKPVIDEAEATVTSEELLAEIRDLLKAQSK